MYVVRGLYFLYSFCIALPLFLLTTIAVATTTMVAALCGDTDHVVNAVTKAWGKLTMWYFLLPVKIEGREQLDKHQSYIFLANHQGYLDILLIYGYLGFNFKWMMKEYLKKIPFVGKACEMSKQIYVGDSRQSIAEAVKQSQTTLRSGMSMVIFPEGTRTRDGEVGEFKRGAFMLAGEIGLPIVPITITGSYECFNRRAWHVSWHPLKLTIHTPITVEEQQTLNSKTLMQKVRSTIIG